eukprot:CAMPEP_0175222220 /NCGR_PEP_ID=MMETSP0093-20121207/20712_1 /TAXON_ID=311494 /ORGANISM="Alexandrium monilatum, Strain CCMP3105" /LENGTH=62 /DNA_ID=CAMNT_0016515801 /DNA_START=87 /DNA_END=271 /DNA_ORIENTATION=-
MMGIITPEPTLRAQALPFLPFLAGASFSFACDSFSAKTCLTHFCSSIRKARITRIRVHLAHR